MLSSTNRWTPRRMALLALFMALSAVGAQIKIPSITGTPALDSLPGYLGALLFGPLEGALIAFLGHLLTAFTVGFPLSPFIHLLIALGMAAVVAVTALVARLSLVLGVVAGIVLNGLFLPAMFIPVPGFGKAFFLAMVVPLLIASAINVMLAAIIYTRLKKIFPHNQGRGMGA